MDSLDLDRQTESEQILDDDLVACLRARGSRMKTYCSIIQYCPCPARRECANVGVILLRLMEVTGVECITNWNPHLPRAVKFFDLDLHQQIPVFQAVEALIAAVQYKSESWTSAGDLAIYAASLGNSLDITMPRGIVLHDGESMGQAIVRLTEELV